MSGSCYTSRISSRAGASPSPEKSPSRLPQRGGGLAEATERARRGVFGRLASLLPASGRTYIWGDFLKSARPEQKPCKCQTQGMHTSPHTSRCPDPKPRAGHCCEPSLLRAAWHVGSPLRPHGQTDFCPSSREDLDTSSLPTSASTGMNSPPSQLEPVCKEARCWAGGSGVAKSPLRPPCHQPGPSSAAVTALICRVLSQTTAELEPGWGSGSNVLLARARTFFTERENAVWPFPLRPSRGGGYFLQYFLRMHVRSLLAAALLGIY